MKDPGRYRAIGTILIVALSGFVMGFDGSLFTGAVGFIETEFELTTFELGWAVTSMAVAATVSMFLSGPLADRYAGWDSAAGKAMLSGSETLDSIAARVEKDDINPQPKSGRQEFLENLVNRYV